MSKVYNQWARDSNFLSELRADAMTRESGRALFAKYSKKKK